MRDLDPEALDHFPAGCRFLASVHRKMRAHLGKAGKADIVANAVAQIEAGEFAIFRHEGQTECHGVGGAANGNWLAFKPDCAFGSLIQSEKAVEYFGTA